MQWEEVPEIGQNGIITFYEVQVDPAQFQDVSYINVSGLERVLVIGGLEEYVQYNFTIRAYTIVGPGPFSIITTNTTNQAGKKNTCGYMYIEDTSIVTVLIHLLLLEALNPTWILHIHATFLLTTKESFDEHISCVHWCLDLYMCDNIYTS